jgi:O-acetyl-ADP-ribose deacetylase (regulator of RNase III)
MHIQAVQADISTLAVDAIEQAAVIAIRTVRTHAATLGLESVWFCCFSQADLAVYERILSASMPGATAL